MQERIYLNFIKDQRWLYLVDGLKNTLLITAFALLIGVVLGMLLAVIRTTHDKTGKLRLPDLIAKLYITVIRGTPSVIQLLIFSYCIFTSRIFSGIFIGCIAFGLNSAAYVAEIIRSGIMSIPNGQMEAGRSLGFNYAETMRFIILPQALKNVLPAVFNEFIVLIKETAVIGYVAVQDLTKGGDIIRSRTYDAWTPLLTVALIYLFLTVVLSNVEKRMERRLQNT
ncbi:amino acid ABC transporter permease [Oribacterium sp. oral taxon 102]|uniref:amino acid ABC transporter permease n=1 Tax=Oribacterium sp. oral taxon 102 TaxID=671214 RepID=UPI0015BF0528|nr:amino acid ABC transporter permease [Oribacterium sp. oral taxon 102]NWO22065.1 amino acid ABC transporter permease [Oribacterium sp. oral taxon 102]